MTGHTEYFTMECEEFNCKWTGGGGYIAKKLQKPDVLCIQETWLRPTLDFVLRGYHTVRRDRTEGSGEGCIIFF